MRAYLLAGGLVLPSLLLAFSSSAAAITPPPSVHDFCQRYAEDYARRNRRGSPLRGAGSGAAGGAIVGALIGSNNAALGAASGGAIGALGAQGRRSRSSRNLTRDAYNRCVRDRGYEAAAPTSALDDDSEANDSKSLLK